MGLAGLGLVGFARRRSEFGVVVENQADELQSKGTPRGTGCPFSFVEEYVYAAGALASELSR